MTYPFIPEPHIAAGHANLHRRYFLGDLHLFDEAVWGERGVSMEDPQVHLDLVRERVMALPPGSTLYLLGNVAAAEELEQATVFLRELSRRVRLVLINGVGEPWHPYNANASHTWRPWMPQLLGTFWRVVDVEPIEVEDPQHCRGRRMALLHHLPYAEHLPQGDPFKQWRPRDEGEWLIHGHTRQDTPLAADRPRQVCVSWEAWEAIPSLEEVLAQFQLDREARRRAPDHDSALCALLLEALESDRDEPLEELEDRLLEGDLAQTPLDVLLSALSPLFCEHGRYEHLPHPDGTVSVSLATGGWSECEAALGLLERTRGFQWRISLESWHRGGAYEFILDPAILQELARAQV